MTIVLPSAPFGVELPLDEAEQQFWAARPEFDTLRTWARARMVSPWAVLGVALLRVLSQVPPGWVLPPTIGTFAGLNLFVGVVGASGDGKDAAIGVAEDAIEVGEPVAHLPIGTGEGIRQTYVTSTKDEDTGKWRIDQHTESAIFEASEIDKVAAHAARKGATLLSTLREAWTGSKPLGATNADAERRNWVSPHRYRLGLIVGVQPGRGRALLNEDEIAGGTPQRFVWLPGADADMPDVEPDEPEPLKWRLPDPPREVRRDGQLRVLPVCLPVAREIKAAHRARRRGQGDAIGGHAMLAREKVAAALGLLAGRAEVTIEDWELAGTVMRVSDRTREAIEKVLGEAASRENAAKGKAEAARAVMVDEARADSAISRVVETILRRLGTADGAVSRADLRRALQAVDRDHFDEAAGRLIGTGQIEAETVTKRGQSGVQYRLSAARR